MLKILVVCTGNICRSPLAEMLLRQRLSDLPLDVASAGTKAPTGREMDPQAARLAQDYGVSRDSVRGHRSRLLEPKMLQGVDLLLAMDRGHRRAIAELGPAFLRRTFTWRELALLSQGLNDEQLDSARDPDSADSSDSLARLLSIATAQRGTAAFDVAPGDLDVVDPFRRSPATHRKAAESIMEGLPQIERLLRYATRSTGVSPAADRAD